MRRFTFWAVGFTVLIIVVFNIAGWLILRQTSRYLETELGARLQSVATTLGTTIGTRYQEPAARRLMSEVLEKNNLFNIYIVDESLRYLYNARAPEQTGLVDPALEPEAAEIIAAFSGVPSQSRLYAAGGYYLKTAYAPIEDSLGLAQAVIGVEADARFFSVLARFRNSLLFTSGLSFCAILAIVLVSFSLARHTLKVEQAAARANTLALMGQLSAAIAHEIKNPLAIILAATERLQKRYNAHDDQTFGYIREEVDRLNRVVTNYLSLGSTRADRLEPVDLKELIGNVLATVEHDTRRLGIVVETQLDNLPPVNASRLALRQVFLNLVLNAIQAQPSGGLLRISGTTGQSGGRRWVVIKVADHGPGIRPKDRLRVFQPFWTTKEKGSGLGLFVAKRVIEEHGGRVRIIDTGEIGTTFELRLPL
ncbi:MAG: ATP-binding protein [candidate division WOR-3 bacterium]